MSNGTKVFLFLVAVITLLYVTTPVQPPQTVQSQGSPAAEEKASKEVKSNHAVTGQPTVTGQFIDTILCTWQSPACGRGQQLHDLGAEHGIDPVYALAFYLNESTFGTKGMARMTLALGNERCIQGRPCINSQGGECQAGQSCYAKFYSLEDGFEHWYRMIKHGYVEGDINKYIGRNACPCVTVAQIIPVYAPQADNNNEQHYISVVERAVSLWRAGKVALS